MIGDTNSDSPSVRFVYTQTNPEGEKTELDYRVWLHAVSCRFGGRRFYFVCPLVRNNVPCSRKVSVMYLDGKWFGCRKCHNLAYGSQQEPRSRALGTVTKYWIRGLRLEKKAERMRVKFWRGRPTKRYLRLLQATARNGIFDIEKAQRELYLLLGSTKN